MHILRASISHKNPLFFILQVIPCKLLKKTRRQDFVATEQQSDDPFPDFLVSHYEYIKILGGGEIHYISHFLNNFFVTCYVLRRKIAMQLSQGTGKK